MKRKPFQLKPVEVELPSWIDKELYEQWSEGGKVVFAKEKDSTFWVVVEFDYAETDTMPARRVLQLHRYFSIGFPSGKAMMSCDIDARTDEAITTFALDALEKVLR